jgi:hypothetical protein
MGKKLRPRQREDLTDEQWAAVDRLFTFIRDNPALKKIREERRNARMVERSDLSTV